MKRANFSLILSVMVMVALPLFTTHAQDDDKDQPPKERQPRFRITLQGPDGKIIEFEGPVAPGGNNLKPKDEPKADKDPKKPDENQPRFRFGIRGQDGRLRQFGFGDQEGIRNLIRLGIGGMGGFINSKQAYLRSVDLKGDGAVTVELLPDTARLDVAGDTLYIQDGKIVQMKNLADESNICGVFSPATGSATAVLELEPDQRVSTLQAVFRRVKNNELTLKNSLIETVDIEKAIILSEGKQIKVDKLVAEDRLIVIVIGTRIDPLALLVIKVAKGDDTVKTVKARLAPVPEFPGMPGMSFLPITSGKIEKKVLKVDKDTKIYPSRMARFGFGPEGKKEQLTIEQLKEKLEKDKDLKVNVTYSKARGGKNEYFLDTMTLTDGKDFWFQGGGLRIRGVQ